MKLAILMDPLHVLKAYKDTSVGFLKSAAAKGWSCFYFTAADMFCRGGEAWARVSAIAVGDVEAQDWAIVGAPEVLPLSVFDIILMRKDPPFDMEYIYTTYALQLAEQAGVLVANKPSALREVNEKFFTLHFSECTPDTLVSKDTDRLRAFWQEHGNVIFKPLDGMGGSRVFHVAEDGRNLSVILEVLTCNQTETIVAQQYIPDIVSKGDKRILLINGEPVPYGLARIPAVGELRGNLAAGASGVVVPITERDRFICQKLAPVLREKGLYFVGIDVIGDYVTEINVTSPTCAIEIARESGIDITGDYLDCLAKIRLGI